MKTVFISILVGVTLLVLIGALLLIKFATPVKENKLSLTKKIAYISVLTALCSLTNMYSLNIDKTFSISFIAIPCFVAGCLLGYIEGFAVGFVGDLIGCMIMPKGTYSPILSLSSGLWGFIPGVIFKYLDINDYIKTVISFLICLIVCTWFLNSFGLWYIYAMGKKTFWVYMYLRIPLQSLNTLINGVLCLALIPVLKKISPK